ncbi:zinc metallopeptidase [bacterium]|nr:zinc metallopeptidase [bacterium]
MFFWDPTFILLIPAIAFALWAQSQIKKSYAGWSDIDTDRKITGADAAKIILSANGLDVKIEKISGKLTDNYDPRSKILHLSEGVYDSQSVAAVGIAAHECGHAIQHANKYAPLKIRNSIVPVVSISSNLAFPIFFIGIIFSIPIILKIGIWLFAGVVVFQLITLPVEFDASHRALKTLDRMAILSPEELTGAKEVLTAAALTYVAAALMAIVNLLRMLLLSRRR